MSNLQPIRVGILGFGVVGTGLYQVLTENADSIIQRVGRPVTVNWRYSAENDTAQTCGEEFQEDANHVVFNLIEID